MFKAKDKLKRCHECKHRKLQHIICYLSVKPEKTLVPNTCKFSRLYSNFGLVNW